MITSDNKIFTDVENIRKKIIVLCFGGYVLNFRYIFDEHILFRILL